MEELNCGHKILIYNCRDEKNIGYTCKKCAMFLEFPYKYIEREEKFIFVNRYNELDSETKKMFNLNENSHYDNSNGIENSHYDNSNGIENSHYDKSNGI